MLPPGRSQNWSNPVRRHQYEIYWMLQDSERPTLDLRILYNMLLCISLRHYLAGDQVLACTNSYSKTIPIRLTTVIGSRTSFSSTTKTTQIAYDQCALYLYKHRDQSTGTSYDCSYEAKTIMMEATVLGVVKAPLATVSVSGRAVLNVCGHLGAPVRSPHENSTFWSIEEPLIIFRTMIIGIEHAQLEDDSTQSVTNEDDWARDRLFFAFCFQAYE
ncbi:hypothetical protein QBC38DRAFT_548752 [Podospora fimiseda]|uniref:Uncharacterized protein n=1 Tax=Podospora fimiseda TaxID=252190 RepID=A0AAN6YPI6_9PEZI|nr:hypothetical protein QBC38DRAFT_548752 [Podospora fimiseda]